MSWLKHTMTNKQIIDLPKKKPGRKPLQDGAGKTARIELRVKPDIKQSWRKKAKCAGMTMQSWVESKCNSQDN
jgi:hypothetical protein